jgi:hypothetical protein
MEKHHVTPKDIRRVFRASPCLTAQGRYGAVEDTQKVYEIAHCQGPQAIYLGRDGQSG